MVGGPLPHTGVSQWAGLVALGARLFPARMPPRKATMMIMGRMTNVAPAKPDVVEAPCEVVTAVIVLASGVVVAPPALGPALDGPGVVTVVVMVWVEVAVVVVGGRVTVEVEVWVVVDVDVDVVVTAGSREVLVVVVVRVVALVTVAVAVVVTVVVVINPAGTGEHPTCEEELAPADPRGAITETEPAPLFAT
jgi:hypothetical protein